jgi:nitroreductase
MNSISRRNALAGGGALVLAGASASVIGYRHMAATGNYDAAVAGSRAALPQRPSSRELVRYATLAPNGHNTQPWKFRVAVDQIDILPDFSRRTPVVDPDDHHLFVSLGAAAENLSLAAAARGHSGEVVFDPRGNGAVRVALQSGPPVLTQLFDAIRHRQSTRAVYDGRQVRAADLRQLAATAVVPGVDVVIITDRAQMAKITDLIVAGNSAQMADPAFVTELKHWLRFNPPEALARSDGLFSVASGNPVLPTWLGPFLFDQFASAASQNEQYKRQLRSSAGIALFLGEAADPTHWVQVGRACQRFALQATALGLKHAFVNQPVEVAQLRPALAALAGMPGRRPDIVMRFGYGPILPYSLRRPAASVIVT